MYRILGGRVKKEKQQRLVTNFTSAIIIISLQCNIIHCVLFYIKKFNP